MLVCKLKVLTKPFGIGPVDCLAAMALCHWLQRNLTGQLRQFMKRSVFPQIKGSNCYSGSGLTPVLIQLHSHSYYYSWPGNLQHKITSAPFPQGKKPKSPTRFRLLSAMRMPTIGIHSRVKCLCSRHRFFYRLWLRSAVMETWNMGEFQEI